jgi:hypothetical protein
VPRGGFRQRVRQPPSRYICNTHTHAAQDTQCTKQTRVRFPAFKRPLCVRASASSFSHRGVACCVELGKGGPAALFCCSRAAGAGGASGSGAPWTHQNWRVCFLPLRAAAAASSSSNSARHEGSPSSSPSRLAQRPLPLLSRAPTAPLPLPASLGARTMNTTMTRKPNEHSPHRIALQRM